VSRGSLVDKIQRLSPAGLADFGQLRRVGRVPSVRFYPLASQEEITVCRLLDDRRTHNLIYGPDGEGKFVFQCRQER
jgi:hypothetical protein